MIFNFKEFSIKQEKTAMKVGTDGVLLGAWTSLNHFPDSILDIGTGTGLIALQLAQRSDAMTIDALEINNNAYEEAVENFENSSWSDRLFCYHASLQEFTAEIDDKYDLIVSNPPFFKETYLSNDNDRNDARFTNSLSFETLITSVAKLLSKNGLFTVIIPFNEQENFIKIAENSNLFISEITNIKGNKNVPYKRCLLSFLFVKQVINTTELIIEIERHKYTKPYINLVKDFYLKM